MAEIFIKSKTDMMYEKLIWSFLFLTGLVQIIIAHDKRPPIWEAGLQYNLSIDTTTIETLKNINYQKETNDFTTLDIYRPADNKLKPPLPVVILNHGGPVSTDISVKPKDW